MFPSRLPKEVGLALGGPDEGERGLQWGPSDEVLADESLTV